MKKKFIIYVLLLCFGTACVAQSKFGFTVGLQPALRNHVQPGGGVETSDFPVFFMKHFMAGFFFRRDYTKYFYVEADICASIDAQWGYVSDGETFWEEFARAFDRPNKIHADIPIYLGWYILNREAFRLRVFGCPQYKIRANTDLAYSPVDWSNFSLNVGAGVDLLSFLAVNINYRIPFNYGKTSFDETRVSLTVGLYF